jgi:hypothetical protein
MKTTLISIVILFAANGALAQTNIQSSQVSVQSAPILMTPQVCAAPELTVQPTIETNGICFQSLDDCNRQRLILSDMERAGLSFSAKCDQVLGAGLCEGNNFVLTVKVSVKPETVAAQSPL